MNRNLPFMAINLVLWAIAFYLLLGFTPLLLCYIIVINIVILLSALQYGANHRLAAQLFVVISCISLFIIDDGLTGTPVTGIDLDKWNIRPDAAIELDKVVVAMKDHPDWRVQISAHTDCRESESYNMVLSQRRANSTATYLEQHGIQGLRLKPVGFGKTRPAIFCDCTPDGKSGCSEEQHQMNRRVEFVILNTDALSERR